MEWPLLVKVDHFLDKILVMPDPPLGKSLHGNKLFGESIFYLLKSVILVQFNIDGETSKPQIPVGDIADVLSCVTFF